MGRYGCTLAKYKNKIVGENLVYFLATSNISKFTFLFYINHFFFVSISLFTVLPSSLSNILLRVYFILLSNIGHPNHFLRPNWVYDQLYKIYGISLNLLYFTSHIPILLFCFAIFFVRCLFFFLFCLHPFTHLYLILFPHHLLCFSKLLTIYFHCFNFPTSFLVNIYLILKFNFTFCFHILISRDNSFVLYLQF